MKTFRELDQAVSDWITLPAQVFAKKYDLEGFTNNTLYGFVRGVCFALEREVPE